MSFLYDNRGYILSAILLLIGALVGYTVTTWLISFGIVGWAVAGTLMGAIAGWTWG